IVKEKDKEASYSLQFSPFASSRSRRAAAWWNCLKKKTKLPVDNLPKIGSILNPERGRVILQSPAWSVRVDRSRGNSPCVQLGQRPQGETCKFSPMHSARIFIEWLRLGSIAE